MFLLSCSVNKIVWILRYHTNVNELYYVQLSRKYIGIAKNALNQTCSDLPTQSLVVNGPSNLCD